MGKLKRLQIMEDSIVSGEDVCALCELPFRSGLKIEVKGHFDDGSVDDWGKICCLCSEFLFSITPDDFPVRVVIPRY